MSTQPTPDSEPAARAHVDAAPPRQYLQQPGRGGHLRLTHPAATTRSVSTRVARGARIIHGLLIFAIAANVMVIGVDAPLRQRLAAALVAGAVYLAAFRVARRDVTFARLSTLAQGIYRIRAVLTGAFALGAIAWFVPGLGITIGRVAATTVALAAVAATWGHLTRRLLGGTHVSRTLIIGDGEQVGRFVAEFHADPHPGYEICGLLTESASSGDDGSPAIAGLVDEDTTLRQVVELLDDSTGTASGIPVLGNISQLETVLAAEAIDTVVVAVRRGRLELFARLAQHAGARSASDITVQELPAFSEHVFGRVPIDVINAAWFMHMIHPFYRPYSRALKRVADCIAAAVIGVATLPVLPIAALLVRISSPGPILYSQTRVGERGREFRLYKFRTMRVDAEVAGAQWAQVNDPRVTGPGRFMRASRIDELPQLWNVLAGHMSFVGPRPERPEFVGQLEDELPFYQRRHLVKPGITGWAQVRQGYADSVAGAQHKLGYELYYLKHQSLFLDFVIFVETVRVVLRGFGAR